MPPHLPQASGSRWPRRWRRLPEPCSPWTARACPGPYRETARYSPGLVVSWGWAQAGAQRRGARCPRAEGNAGRTRAALGAGGDTPASPVPPPRSPRWCGSFQRPRRGGGGAAGRGGAAGAEKGREASPGQRRAGPGRAGRGGRLREDSPAHQVLSPPPGRRRTGRPPAGPAWGSRAARSSGCCSYSRLPARGSSSPCSPPGGRTRSPGPEPGKGCRAGPDREGAGDGQGAQSPQIAFHTGLVGVAPSGDSSCGPLSLELPPQRYSGAARGPTASAREEPRLLRTSDPLATALWVNSPQPQLETLSIVQIWLGHLSPRKKQQNKTKQSRFCRELSLVTSPLSDSSFGAET